MEKEIEFTNPFQKDLKKALRQGHNHNKLKDIVDLLKAGKSIPRKHKPHKLQGNWRPKWECHIEPDWLLIYEVLEDRVILYRTGSHAELF